MSDSKSSGEQWSDKELAAAIDAYRVMLDAQNSGREYSKSEVIQRLLKDSLQGRTKASAEFRMQNLSAILHDLGLAWVKGYPPAKNVGAGVKKRVLDLLSNLGSFNVEDYEPTADEATLKRRVASLRERGLASMPIGVEKPTAISATSMVFARSAAVKAWVLSEAGGRCEACGENAPFNGNDGEPYLEVHHIIPLAMNGPDTPQNAVALCPNCHRRAHFSSDRGSFVDRLQSSIARLRVSARVRVA